MTPKFLGWSPPSSQKIYPCQNHELQFLNFLRILTSPKYCIQSSMLVLSRKLRRGRGKRLRKAAATSVKFIWGVLTCIGEVDTPLTRCWPVLVKLIRILYGLDPCWWSWYISNTMLTRVSEVASSLLHSTWRVSVIFCSSKFLTSLPESCRNLTVKKWFLG